MKRSKIYRENFLFRNLGIKLFLSSFIKRRGAMSKIDLIYDKLRTIKNPLGGGTDIVRSGWVKEVSFENGSATVTVKLPIAIRGREEGFIQQLEYVVKQVDGVDRVVVEKQFQEIPHPGFSPKKDEPKPIRGVKHSLAIASGKGGVGKSTVACNLAIALKQMGFSVGLLDGDIYGPSIPKMMGLEGAMPQIKNNLIVPVEKYGIKVLSIGFLVEEDTAVIWRGPLIHKAYDQFFFQTYWGDLDFLILDLPPGTGDPQISATKLLKLDGGVVVTTPQDVALSDVKKAISMFRTMDVNVIGLIENMSYYKCPNCGHIERIFGKGGGRKLSEEMAVTLLGEIPIDPKMTQQGDMGIPTVEADPDGPVAKAMGEIARKIAKIVGENVD